MNESRPSGLRSALNGLGEVMRAHLHLARTLLLGLLAAASIGAYLAGALDGADHAFWDFCFRHRPAQYVSPKIVIIEINEAAIRTVGRWPWDREWHATLIQALKDFGAKSITLDMVFSERANARTDDLLSKVIKNSQLVYLPVAYEHGDGQKEPEVIRSLPEFAEAAAGEGHAVFEPDGDGVLRTVQAYFTEGSQRQWQIAFRLALDTWGLDPSDIRIQKDSLLIPISANAPLRIGLDASARMRVNWPGPWNKSFRRISYVDIIQAYSARLKGEKTSFDPSILQGAVCLVGVTASGLFDIYTTPQEASYPTVGATASVLNTLLERSPLNPVSRRTHIFILLGLAVVLLVVMLRANTLQSFFWIGLIAILYTAGAYAVFAYARQVVSWVYPMTLILSGYAVLAAYHQIMVVIEKNHLLKLATTDPLTGLANIGHFKRLLEAELQSTRLRAKKDICLVMVDGDHFKKVNDTYGHAAGDDVLRGLADVLRTHCRALDIAARYGGEEFILMLPGATLEAGLKVAEKIRAGVEHKKHHLGPGGAAVHFTASFGVVAFVPGESMDDFLKRADEALYLAKKSGRNCVCTV